MSNCNFDTCRYNKDSKCANSEKGTGCVEVLKAVPCIIYDEAERNQMNICITNRDCIRDPEKCGYSVECSSFEDIGNGRRVFVCGLRECKYQK